MSINPLALVGLDCPACGGTTECESECVCPTCWPDRHADSLENSLRQWAAFAPALAHMNEAGITWGWSTDFSRPTNHSVEILLGDNALVEVFNRAGKWGAEYCERNKRDNTWGVAYSASFMHPHEITDWVNKFR
jgi:hypothetical protein